MAELAGRMGELAEVERAAGRIAARNGHGRAAGEGIAAAGGVVSELERCLKELEALGVEVRDVATGLLDFPALRDGEEVLLCWRLGEPEVAWWHRREDGFAGRQPIDWDEQ